MSGVQTKLRWLPVAVASVTILATAAAGWWALMTPKIKTASPQEVRSAVPKELMETDSVDPAAVRRGELVSAELSALEPDLPDLYKLSEAAAKPSGEPVSAASVEAETWPAAPAEQFVEKAGPKLTALERTLAGGPIAHSDPKSLPPLLSKNMLRPEEFERGISWCARVLARQGRDRDAATLLSTGLALADRVYGASTGDVMANILAVGDETTVLRAIDRVAQTDRITPDECRALLAEVTAAPADDEVLCKAIRGDFQSVALPTLIQMAAGAKGRQSDSDDTQAGTYEPIETARLVGQVELALLQNARKPLSEYDPAADRLASSAADGLPPLLPDDSDDSSKAEPSWWDKIKTRYVMDSGHNTIGRQLVGAISLGQDCVKASCKWRALREATRVLLAAHVYASRHGGKFPASTAGFVPILGAWPSDPFNGKPMLYNASKAIVYSVGANLIDDGGQVAGKDPPDLGVRLHGP